MDPSADYLDSPVLDGDDVAYPCKGCGDILEEGKAFELAGNRWHLNCFRCNTCGTLLDSDANLLLLGDGSLICNNCTYSCSACGNKIEDLAILTGDQAFCATCFRCRNCKRKIENLRYARTSQGIFCMSCHESLMARRRKKSRAAGSTKIKKDENSPMLKEKSLPALPPGFQSNFSGDQDVHPSTEGNTPTEASPRPRYAGYANDSSSRSSSRRPREPSIERPASGGPSKEGLTLPNTTYRSNRYSTISQASDQNGDGEYNFIPLALDPSPVPTPSSRSVSGADPAGNGKDSRYSEKDYFESKGRAHDGKSLDVSSAASTPHIGFQEKGRQPSAEETERIKENLRRAQAGGRSSAKPSPAIGSDVKPQHAHSSTDSTGQAQGPTENFRLGDVPRTKKYGNSRDFAHVELPGESSVPRSSSGGLSLSTPRIDTSRGIPKSESSQQQMSAVELPDNSWIAQDTKTKEDPSKPSIDSSNSTSVAKVNSEANNKPIARKEIGTGASKNVGSISSSSGQDTASSSASSSETPGVTPTVNGKTISGPLHQMPLGEDIVMPPPTRAPTRPPGPQHQVSDSYMAPRAAPPLPPTSPKVPKESQESTVNGSPSSPELPRWSSGGDFTMDEDMARILGGTDESSQSILRRVSNAVRHGRSGSEISAAVRQQGHNRSASETTTRTAQSPRWSRPPIAELSSDYASRGISSPTSVHSPSLSDEPALLRRQLRNSEQRVAELERQASSEKDLKTLNKKLIEKRKTVSVLDSQTEIMIRQLETLAGHVEKAKESKQPVDIADLEDSAIKDFCQKMERIKQTVAGQVESLYEERNQLMEEKNRIIAERDRALVEFEQLSSKNAQLADMNNDLTHQIQERFKAQSGGAGVDSPKPASNGLGIYTHHKEKSNVSVQLDDGSIRPSTSSTTVIGSTHSYPHSMEQEEPATVLSAPHVVNIRKGQAKKFNWKKGGQTVAKGMTKGFKGAFSSMPPDRQWEGQTTENIGMPYNATKAPTDAPPPTGASSGSLPRSASNDPARQGFGLFKKSTTMPKLANGSAPAAENPSVLFGSDLVERANYERRQIPSVVTRCIEEVELRGMDIEGIYRKTGGNSQVKTIIDGFEKTDDYDISDPSLDITAVTSVLKQYFRRLPVPLLTFDVYDRILESTGIDDKQDRCSHLRKTFSMLPPKHRDCLEFLIFHLARVAVRERENLMTPKNLAVVFAPTIMRDTNLDRELTDMHSKNLAVQFIVDNSYDIFTDS